MSNLHTLPTMATMRDLPPTLSVRDSCQILGIGDRTGYQMIRDGRFPAKVIRTGRCKRVVTASLLRCLEIDDEVPA